jgi:hypothetical protein
VTTAKLWAAGCLCCCGTALGQSNLVETNKDANKGAAQWRPMTTDERIDWYLKRTTGRQEMFKGLAVAGLATLRDSPHEWEQGAEGLFGRLAARQARVAVSHSVQLGMGFLLKDDPRYWRAPEKGVGGRLKNAFVSAFTVRDQQGGRMPAYSRFAGIAAGNLAAKTWLPPSRNSWGDVAARSGAQLGGQVGWNVFREFWPDIKRAFRK